MAGARIVGVEEGWGSDLVVKVKEPQAKELGLLREGPGAEHQLTLPARELRHRAVREMRAPHGLHGGQGVFQ